MTPPIEVLAVLLREADEASPNAKGAAKLRHVQTSILDELIMSSRVGTEGAAA